MFVDVKTEKRQQTLECHPSSLLSAVQLNRVQRLSVARKKPVLTPRREVLKISFFSRNLFLSTTPAMEVDNGSLRFKLRRQTTNALLVKRSEKTFEKWKSYL